MDSIEYGFVHIPKNGGTSVCEFLHKNYPKTFVCNTINGKAPYHSLTTAHADVPIVIIRNPVDRFLSAYYYWRNGPINGPHKKVYKDHPYTDLTIDQFIDLLQKNKSIVNSSITWDVHFNPQYYWIKEEDYAKTIVIRYVKDLSDSIYSLVDYLKLPKYQYPMQKINTCCYNPIELSKYSLDYINSVYYKDFALWQSVLSKDNIFKLII